MTAQVGLVDYSSCCTGLSKREDGTKVDAVMPPVPEINQDFYSDQSYNESELGGLVIYTRLEVGSQFQEIFS